MERSHRIVKYRDEDLNNSDFLINVLLNEYEQGRFSEEDKVQELQRNRRLVEQMLAASAKVTPVKLPEHSKPDESLFEKIEVLMMHKQPLFKVTMSTEKRVSQPLEESIRPRVVIEKLCVCCGNYVKKHCCPHTQCQKPCKAEEKRLRQRQQQLGRRALDENNPEQEEM